MVDFLFALMELFSLSIMVPGLRGEMCTARLFSQGVDLFALTFYLGGVDGAISINHSWQQKLQTLDYPMVKTASLCVFSF